MNCIALRRTHAPQDQTQGPFRGDVLAHKRRANQENTELASEGVDAARELYCLA
jgi:hypothetical protein